MINYLSIETYTSTAMPDVVFHLRRMSHGRRIKLNQQASKSFAKVAGLQADLRVFQEELNRATDMAKTEPCKCPEGSDHLHNAVTFQCEAVDCDCRRPMMDPEIGSPDDIDRLSNEIYAVIVDELYPEYIRWGVSKIDGLTIDGQPATAESLLDGGPEILVAEVGNAIYNMLGLSDKETKGFKSPITSDAQADGPILVTSASSAKGTADIDSASA